MGYAQQRVTSPLAAAIAAYGLPTDHTLPREPLDDAVFGALLEESEHHRILGLLGTAVRDDAFAVTDPQRERLDQTWAAWLGHAVRAERLLLDATEILEAHRIRSFVLKGAALAHAIYPDPAMRVVGDVDVLVEPANFTRAANVLIAEADASRGLPEIRRGFDDRYGKEVLLRIRDLEFDLHRTFSDGALGQTIRLEELVADPTPFGLGGRPLHALGHTPMTMHAAYNACFGDHPRRLIPMRDLVELNASCGDPAAIIECASRWRASAVLAMATRISMQELGVLDESPLSQWARHFHSSALERLLVRAHSGPGRGYTRQAAALWVVPGLRAKWSYGCALAFPDAAYLSARGVERMTFVRGARAKIRSRA